VAVSECTGAGDRDVSLGTGGATVDRGGGGPAHYHLDLQNCYGHSSIATTRHSEYFVFLPQNLKKMVLFGQKNFA
jgi:hypothetical protein